EDLFAEENQLFPAQHRFKGIGRLTAVLPFPRFRLEADCALIRAEASPLTNSARGKEIASEIVQLQHGQLSRCRLRVPPASMLSSCGHPEDRFAARCFSPGRKLQLQGTVGAN